MTPAHKNQKKISNATSIASLEKLEALRQQNRELTERYAALSSATSEALLICLGERCVECNNAAERLFGYSHDQMLNIAFSNLVPTDWQDKLQGLLQNKYTDFVKIAVYTRSNELIWTRARSRQITFQGQQAIALGFIDISDEMHREASLQDSQAFYRNLFDLSPAGIVLENDKGTILNVNAAFCRMMGYEPSNLIGHHINILTHPENKAHIADNIRRILAGEEINQIEKSQRKDGSVCYIHLIEKRTVLPDGSVGIISIAQDITKPYQLQMALEESERHLDLIINSIRLGTWEENLQTGEITRNALWAEMLGYAPTEVAATRDFWLQIVHPDDLPRVKEVVALFEQNTQDEFEVEHRLRHKDGSWRWILNWGKVVEWTDDGRKLRVAGAHLDITERKEAERKLQDSENRYRQLINSLPSPALVHVAGKVRFINPAALKVFGCDSAQEVLGQDLFKWIHPDFREIIRQRVRQVYNGQPLLDHMQQKFLRKDGSEVDVEVMAKPIEYEGSPASMVVFTDVSERVKAQVALEESELRFRTIVEHAHAGILLIDDDYHILYTNPRFAEISGYESVELHGQNFQMLLDEESRELVSKRYKMRQQGKQVPSHYEFNILRKDGALRRVEISSTALTDSSGNRLTIAQLLDITDRQLAESALRASEESYRLLAETAQDCIILHGMDGTISYANQAAQQLTGYAENLTGKKIESLVLPEFQKTLKTHRKDRLSGNSSRLLYELEISTACGEQIPLEVSSSLLTINEKPAGVLLIARDIRERKASLQALRDSEHKFKQLVDNSLTGIYITQNHILKFCNEKFAEIFGYQNTEEIVGKHVRELVHPDSWALVDSEVKLRESGLKETSRYEFQCVRRDGTLFDVEVLGGKITYQDAVAVQGTMIDISERKRSQRQITRLATVVEQAAESIIITDTDGYIQYVNPAFTEISGYSASEALNKKPSILKSGKHDKAFYKELWDTIIAGRRWQGTLLNKKRNGETYFEKAVIFPIKDSREQVINFAAIMRDITAERQLESQLQQIQKMEAIGTLSGGIAHDFNNLLTVINGHAELAMLRTAKDAKSQADFLSILKAGKRAEKLTNQLLAFSRKQVHELKVVEINTVIRDLEKMLRRLIPADITIEQQLHPNPVYIKADSSQIEQILINLVINARDAIRERGDENPDKRITVKTEIAVPKNTLFTERTQPADQGWLAVSVCDTGTGITEDLKDRIFEPFFTTKEVGKGTGLGLATVYGIAQQNRALLAVDSKPGEGTCFKIYWEVSAEQPTVEQPESEHAPDLKGDETILFVEDDQEVRNFACTALKTYGYTIHEATNGRMALELIEKQQLQPDIIITDLIMPEMTGKDLIQAIRNFQPNVQVLYVSGYTYDHLVSDGSLQPGIHFLQKPYSVQSLAKTIHELLQKRQSNKN